MHPTFLNLLVEKEELLGGVNVIPVGNLDAITMFLFIVLLCIESLEADDGYRVLAIVLLTYEQH